MDLTKLTAKPRSERGKGSARRLRASDMIPATAYGRELTATSLAVSPKALVDVLQSPLGRNTPIELDVDGQKLTVLLNDFQYHPVTRKLLHADFYQIALDRPVDVQVPFEVTGKPKGVILGGTLRQVFRKLPVRCLPANIPTKLSHDVTELDLNQHVLTSELQLPEGVTVTLPPTQTLVAVVSEKVVEEEVAAPGAAAPGAAAAAGTEGAPAAAAPEKAEKPEKSEKKGDKK